MQRLTENEISSVSGGEDPAIAPLPFGDPGPAERAINPPLPPIDGLDPDTRYQWENDFPRRRNAP
jgi:hypothetical protein